MTYLLNFTDEAEAQADRPDLFVTDEGLDSGKGMVVTAFTKQAVQPDYDSQGEPIEGTGEPAEIAPGYWVLLIDAVNAPPITLPAGIVAISPIYTSPMQMPVAE